MKIKKTRVRPQDICAGTILYIAHPWYGIEKVVALARPHVHSHRKDSTLKGTLWVKTKKTYSDGFVHIENSSLRDMGVMPGKSRNSRRTFLKLKQAQAYVKWGLIDPECIKQHDKHIRLCAQMDRDLGMY